MLKKVVTLMTALSLTLPSFAQTQLASESLDLGLLTSRLHSVDGDTNVILAAEEILGDAPAVELAAEFDDLYNSEQLKATAARLAEKLAGGQDVSLDEAYLQSQAGVKMAGLGSNAVFALGVLFWVGVYGCLKMKESNGGNDVCRWTKKMDESTEQKRLREEQKQQ